MIALFSNPELIRCARAQLRPGRLLAVAAICAAVSLAIGYSYAYGFYESAPPNQWAREFLVFVVIVQTVALGIGGGIACLQAISREKEMNTFDFQRVTRLTPLELTLGKLFGAPAMTYFVVLCLMPAALVGAVVGRVRPSFFVAAYVVLLLGSITAHAFALLASLLVERGAASGAVLLFLMMMGYTSVSDYGVFTIGKLSPFFAQNLVLQTRWATEEIQAGSPHEYGPRLMDVFFGLHVHHFAVLLVIYLTFTAWFLLAVCRNIKRDPSVYELYSAGQSLGLAIYVNLLLVGFFSWRQFAPFNAQATLLGLNLALFFALGFILLRNRDRLRRRVRELGDSATGWLAATWPAPLLVVGTLLVGLTVAGMIHWQRNPKQEWDLTVAVFRVVFFAAWLVRDVLYLQWVYLTRIRRPLLMGIVYLIVFYSCTSVLFAALDFYDVPAGAPFTAMFVPAAIFELGTRPWAAHATSWMLALGALVLVSGLFAFLQRQRLLELAARPTAPAPAPSPAD